jgi:hypothetical protein
VLAAHAAILGITRRKVDEAGRPLRLSRLDNWILALKERIGMFKTTVALANKMARIAWVILAKGELQSGAGCRFRNCKIRDAAVTVLAARHFFECAARKVGASGIQERKLNNHIRNFTIIRDAKSRLKSNGRTVYAKTR